MYMTCIWTIFVSNLQSWTRKLFMSRSVFPSVSPLVSLIAFRCFISWLFSSPVPCFLILSYLVICLFVSSVQCHSSVQLFCSYDFLISAWLLTVFRITFLYICLIGLPSVFVLHPFHYYASAILGYISLLLIDLCPIVWTCTVDLFWPPASPQTQLPELCQVQLPAPSQAQIPAPLQTQPPALH